MLEDDGQHEIELIFCNLSQRRILDIDPGLRAEREELFGVDAKTLCDCKYALLQAKPP